MNYQVLMPKRLLKPGALTANLFVSSANTKPSAVPPEVVPELQEWLLEKGTRGVDWDFDAMPFFDYEKGKFEKRGFLFFDDENDALQFRLTWG